MVDDAVSIRPPVGPLKFASTADRRSLGREKLSSSTKDLPSQIFSSLVCDTDLFIGKIRGFIPAIGL